MEVSVALDTNAYVDLMKADPRVVGIVRSASRVLIPLPVLAELRSGFVAGTRARSNERVLTRLLNEERVEILFPDETTTTHYARLHRQLREQGTPIPINDLWIAALVVQHGCMPLHQPQAFEHLPQLDVV